MKTTLAILAMIVLASAAAAVERLDDVVSVEGLAGWRLDEQTHMAALHIRLAPGWKTYWRAPGDAGIPPRFHWQSSRNISALEPIWPRPIVFTQNSLKSVGYDEVLVLPLRLDLAKAHTGTELNMTVEIGVCKDVCIPISTQVALSVPAGGTPDPRIVAALSDQPILSKSESRASAICAFSPRADGLQLDATITMPDNDWVEAVIIEAPDQEVWISQPKLRRDARSILASSQLINIEGAPFAVERDRLRLSLFGASRAVEITGCASGS